MSFFANFFKKKESESVVLIDIGADSVGGACAMYAEGDKPSLLYTKRLPIEIRKDEQHEVAMLRTLAMLCETLIKEGSPVLLHASGSGRIDTILVSVDAPWQETGVRTERFERRTPFIFTKSMVDTAMGQTIGTLERRIIVGQSIIGTILNGYETRNPYGKKVYRASAIILSSFIDKKIASAIISTIRGAYHMKNIIPITNSSLRYQAMRYAFPHEHEMVLLDATSPITTISLVRRGLFVGIAEVATQTGSSVWVDGIMTEFSKLAEKYPLPRSIFLLAQEENTASLLKKISSSSLRSLWLSDNPPTIVSVLPNHIKNFVRQVSTAPPDLPLLLMALYYQHRDAHAH